ncbi:MAG: RNA methyltransferase [bacterium]
MNITSINNEKVKLWSSLKTKKYRDRQGIFLIEGDHLVNIALEKNLVIDLILLEDNYEFKNKFIVTEDIMSKISSQQSISKVCATVKLFEDILDTKNSILLDSLQDPGNVGTIIRSAVAFGFKNVILGPNTVDIYNDKVVRASEGMMFNINFYNVNNIAEIENLKDKGFTLIGTNVEKGESIKTINKDKPIIIIIGNEGRGMDPNIDCDAYVKINMEQSCESLNAGVCASILMNEVYNG